MENTTNIHFRAETDDDNIVWLHFDKADGATNVLNAEVFAQLDQQLQNIAAQVLACLAAWKDADFCRDELGRESPFTPIDEERLNIDGGAVAVGHPVGSSGARIVLHMLKLLERNNARRGMTGICIGGGQGGAMLIERTTG